MAQKKGMSRLYDSGSLATHEIKCEVIKKKVIALKKMNFKPHVTQQAKCQNSTYLEQAAQNE